MLQDPPKIYPRLAGGKPYSLFTKRGGNPARVFPFAKGR